MVMPDLDDIFKLATPKYVYIRDAKLGMLKFFFMGLIFFYVVVYKIMYTCGHLTPNHAGGYGSITMEHPVVSCKSDRTCINKYKSMTDLKYCKQGAKSERLLSKGRDKKVADPEKEGKGGDAELGDFITEPRTCRYIDSDRLTLEETPNQVFVPMRYITFKQEMDKNCYDPELKGFKGYIPKKDTDLECKTGWVTKSSEEFFVADVGDFTLSIQHSYMAPDIGKAGVSTDYKGFFAACPDNHPANIETDCKRMEIPNTTGEIAPEDLEGVVKPEKLGITSLTGTPDGIDQIKFTDLLKLTPVAQNYSWQEDVPDRKLPYVFGHPKTSIRESGGMLMLGIAYDNTGPMRPGIPGIDLPNFALGAIKPLTYTYRPYFIPTKTNKRVEVLQADDSSTTRTLNIWYGVTVQMSFEGKIVVFSFSQLLHGFTTGLVLLSSATTLVIYLALYVFKHKEKYALQMFQLTEDMTRYKKLPDKRDVSSFSGKLLTTAEEQKKPLTLEEITQILVDSEIRLNRLDGRDPNMSFPTSLSEEQMGMECTLRKNQHAKTNKFFEDAYSKGME